MTESGSASGPTLLEDALAAAQNKGGTCYVGLLYDHRPDLAAELREALEHQVSATAISGALKRRGIDLAAHVLQRHRRGACKCQD